MKRTITCIDCPVGCRIIVEIEDGKVIKLSGNECPKGEDYSRSEVESPVRVLTSSVLARNLTLKMIPVRTDGPIPKTKIFEAMNEIKKICVDKTIHVGDIVLKNFLNLGINLVATREALAFGTQTAPIQVDNTGKQTRTNESG